MKRMLTLLLAVGMLFVNAPLVLAKEGNMESVLVSVKEKLDIPSELTEFETGSASDRAGKVEYTFRWSNKESDKSVNINADDKGRIHSYSSYNQEWYGSDEMRIDPAFAIEEAEKMAGEWLRKLAPELYKDNDYPESAGYKGTLNPGSKRFGFSFIRKKDGIDVKNSSANVSVVKTDEGFAVTDIYISWDYDAVFEECANDIGIEEAEKVISEKLPMELIYRKTYDDKYLLEYVSNGTVYISAEDKKQYEEDREEDAEVFTEEKAMMDSANLAMTAAGAQLTRAEITELDKVAELKPADELFNILTTMPELGVSANLKNSVSENTYKSEEGYITRLSAYEEKSDKTGRTSVNASFDAKTGELKSFNRYSGDRADEKRDVKTQEKAYSFLEKYFSEKVKDSEKEIDEYSVTCTRLVNGIKYENNYISASVNGKNGFVEHFNINWDADVSRLPSSENIISSEMALSSRYENYPVKKLYVKAGGKYKIMYTLPEYTIRINAVSADAVDYRGEKTDDSVKGIYSDTKGHWIENIAKELAAYNIYIKGEELMPDKEITQAEFLKLILNGVLGEFWEQDTEALYKNMINRSVITKEEASENVTLSRENAIRFLLKAMGIGEVAELKGIFISSFTDSDSISPDLIGYCAIAQAYGIVRGFDGYLNPKASITRAEALGMIYNYLTRP